MSKDISSFLNSEAPMAPLCYTLLFAVSSGNYQSPRKLPGFVYKSFNLTNAYKLRTKKGVYLGRVSKEMKSITQNNVTQQH